MVRLKVCPCFRLLEREEFMEPKAFSPRQRGPPPVIPGSELW